MPRGASPFDVLDELQRRNPPSKLVVPEVFTEFVAWLGVTLTLGQLVIAKVSYDGLEPQDLRGAERDMARTVFGDVDVIPDIARETVVHVCGRRGGKSYTLEALPLVHAMYTVPLYKVAPGQIPIALVISPNDELRQEVTNYAFGAIRSHPELEKTLVLSPSQRGARIVSEFMVQRPGTNALVGFRGGVATKGGYGGRGKSLVGVALDEAAFFRGAENVVNDVEIYAACIPGLLPGARCTIGTTPWAQAGLVWDLFDENHGHPKSALVSHAPTQVLRPELADEVEQERTKDPDRTERERDAKFMGFGTTQFFSEAEIDRFFSKDVPYPIETQPGDTVRAAVDLGLRSDSSALAVGNGDRVALLKELRPKPGAPLVPSETCNTFAEDAAGLGASYVLADQHYIEALRENRVKLPVAPAPGHPGDVYIACRTRIRDNKFKAAHPDTLVGEARTMMLRLKAQMKEVQGTPIPGGGMSIKLPRWRTGGHCDLLSAVVLLGFQQGGETMKAPGPKPGTSDWEEAERAKRRAALRNRAGKRI